MFSSINPFPHLSSSSSSTSCDPYYINTDHEPVTNIFHNHHYDDPPTVTTPLLTPNTLLNSAAAASIQDIYATLVNGDNHHRQYQCDPFVCLPGKSRPVRKERHSKIYTAQGLRDRRVRLSIEIARKFFDLQDMLGFDKASKTLEWLLSKSKKAIKEVSKSGSEGANKSLSSTTSTTCEVVLEPNGVGGSGEAVKDVVSRSRSNEKNSRKKLEKAAICSNLAAAAAKESRAKARARARERTRVKMCNTIFHHESKNPITATTDNMLNHYSSSSLRSLSHYHNSLKVAALAHNHHQLVEELNSSSSLANLVPRPNIMEESIMIKRKLTPSTIMGFHQKPTEMMGYERNLVMLNDVICNNNRNSNYMPNLPQNLDTNSAIARPSFCTITNMNRSEGLHPYDKHWEAENSSQCLR